jgi:hypothetical protein
LVAGGEIKNITALLSNNELFEVPDFQRNYSWEPKQAEELFQDIVEASRSNDDHFLGSLILHRIVSPGLPARLQVVDGQQRLTTLFLLVALIRDYAHGLSIQNIPDANNHAAPIEVTFQAQGILFRDDQSYRFEPHPLVASLIHSRVFAFPGPNRQALPQKHFSYSLPLRKTYKKLSALLAEQLNKCPDDEAKLRLLNDYLRSIKSKLKLLEVTSDSQSEAYDIFMTLNSRGLPLGASDMVKSEIFKHLTEGLTGNALDARSAELSGDWKVIIDALDKGDLDQFLRHFVVSTESEPVTAKKVYEKVQTRIKGKHDAPKDAKLESNAMLQELMSSAEIYGQLLTGKAPWVASPVKRKDVELSLCLLEEVLDSYRIFLMVVVDPRITTLTSDQRIELIRLTEVVSFRWVHAGLNAQNLENQFQKWSKALRGGSTFEQVVDLIKPEIPHDDSIKREFEEIIESSSFVRAVLFKINQKKWDESHTITYSTSSFHVEHVAPDKPTDHWLGVLFPGDQSNRAVEYDAAVELWGNKTLLDWKINLAIKQKPFAQKKVGDTSPPPNGFKGYKDSNIDITEDLGLNVADWDRDVIAERNKWIADCFVKVWALEEDIPGIISFSEWQQTR